MNNKDILIQLKLWFEVQRWFDMNLTFHILRTVLIMKLFVGI